MVSATLLQRQRGECSAVYGVVLTLRMLRDQEIRFTVHDSPDYYNLKVSVFSEDKRTDLIGEAWVDLNDVVVPGGGKSDLWQGLNCKGKYAGEIRIELTYYDSREKPEKAEHIVSVAEELQQTYGGLKHGVKRRPLPANPHAPSTTPVVIPGRAPPGRAKHGPRDFATPARAASLPPEGPKTYNYPHSQATLFSQSPVNANQHGSSSAGASPAPVEQPPPDQYYGEYDPNLGPQLYEPLSNLAQPDFLPTLGPGRRDRGPLPPQARYAHPQHPQHPPEPHGHAPAPLPHSHSAPAVPMTHDVHPGYDDESQLRTDYPQPIPDMDYQYQQVRQRRNDMPPGWQQEYGSDPSSMQPYVEEDTEPSPPPPPPPVHSNSSPAVPQYGSMHSHPYPPASSRYGATPPSTRQQYVPNSSPLQSIERGYGQQQTPPSHRRPARGQSFDEYGESPYQHSYNSTPNLSPSNQITPPPQRGTPPHGRQYPPRHSVADPYNTPSRPHPLSQEVPRARSPNPYAQERPGSSQHQHDYRGRDAAPLIKPRAISPRPELQSSSAPTSQRKNTYNIQHPVRAFESSDDSPLSTSQRPEPTAGKLPRKSVSPRPSMSESRSSIPFSPDSFGVHNPRAPSGETSPSRSTPIVGWHGQEIDPSDHLPVNSWAPEPAKKTPTKTYGLGRDRDFGPRNSGGITNTAGRVSKDTMINVRRKQSEPEPEAQSSKIRARLVTRPGTATEPLGDHHNFNPVPNPYEQQTYSRGFRDRSPGGMDERGARYGGGCGPPSVPPKVPLQEQEYGPDALSREISSIDLGSSRRSGGAAFVPVRSHRDRNSYYY